MSVQSGKGQRRVEVTPDALTGLLVHEHRVQTTLPDDTRVLAIWPPHTGDERGAATLLVESSEWEPLDEGAPIPRLGVSVERVE